MYNLYYDEINKLTGGLVDRNIPFTLHNLYDGFQIIVFDDNGDKSWDAICHSGSYGHETGLLEVMGYDLIHNDDVMGYLDSNDVLALVDETKEREEF